jgi:flagellar motor switch protein FliG
MKQVIFWIVGLIALYLIAINAPALGNIIKSLSGESVKAIAVLQGRDVKGVTT